MSESKDPLRVQPHLKKAFEGRWTREQVRGAMTQSPSHPPTGINKLQFAPNLDILGMLSPQGEEVPFEYPSIDHEVINPSKTGARTRMPSPLALLTLGTGGNVEVWLCQTETVMRRSVAHTLDKCMKAYAQASSRTDWVQKWQGQMLIATSQTYWTMRV